MIGFFLSVAHLFPEKPAIIEVLAPNNFEPSNTLEAPKRTVEANYWDNGIGTSVY